jgi:exonuclease III
MVPIRFLFLCIGFFIRFAVGDNECPIVTSIEDRRHNKSSLRLVQYNVEWLFIDYYAGMDCPGKGCTWHTLSDAEKHMSYVTNVTRTLHPDIIHFCEVEGCDELNMVTDALNGDELTYTSYLKRGTDTSTGQNVGMLTKIDPIVSLYRSEERISYPIYGTQCVNTSASGTTGVSKHFITEFNINLSSNTSINVAMIGAHLLAIPTDPIRCVQREAQAQVLQNVVSSYILKDYEIILLGDMNDYDGDVSDINLNKPISRVLDILKGNDGQKKGSYKLTNVAINVPQVDRYSDWWDSDNNCNTNSQQDLSMIDHVLVTSGIQKRITNVFIYHGYKEYCGKWDSDHWPVVIDISTV